VTKPPLHPNANAHLAYAILDHIDTDPASHDQMVWFRENECGTAGCFAGWSLHFTGAKMAFARNGYLIAANGELHVRGEAEKALGLPLDGSWVTRVAKDGTYEYYEDLFSINGTYEYYEDLFSINNTREDLHRLVGIIFGPRPVPLSRLCVLHGADCRGAANGRGCSGREEASDGAAG